MQQCPSDYLFSTGCRILLLIRDALLSFMMGVFLTDHAYYHLRRERMLGLTDALPDDGHPAGWRTIPLVMALGFGQTILDSPPLDITLPSPLGACFRTPELACLLGEDQMYPACSRKTIQNVLLSTGPVAFFPHDGIARLPHDLVRYFTC
uniref:hypothetical protein n=1 Tax=Klebsiella pneumoniae TaxID=573 RepID=UPI001C66C0E7